MVYGDEEQQGEDGWKTRVVVRVGWKMEGGLARLEVICRKGDDGGKGGAVMGEEECLWAERA